MYRELTGIFCRASLILTVALMMLSCREECLYKPRSMAGVNFHSVENGSDRHVPVDTLSVYGIGREDSLLYSRRNNIRTISLPLNGNAEESGFVFTFNGKTDTIWFRYKVIPLFISIECGFVLNFDLLETRHTANIVDSVTIVIKEVTSFDDTNIRIYH